MDLGVLLVANLIMRTRPQPRRAGPIQPVTYYEILTDVPYMVFIVGSFMVRFDLHAVCCMHK